MWPHNDGESNQILFAWVFFCPTFLPSLGLRLIKSFLRDRLRMPGAGPDKSGAGEMTLSPSCR